MGLIERSLRWIKLNPVSSGLFLMTIIIGAIFIIISPFLEWESTEETQIVTGLGGIGHGRKLHSGDEIEIKYSIIGNPVDVYFVKGTEQDYEYSNKNVLESKLNSKSGTIKHTVEDDDYYIIHFDGEDFEVIYTYKVRLRWSTLPQIIIGIILIILGVIGIWKTTHFTNPRFFGGHIRYSSLVLIVAGMILIILNLSIREDPTLATIPIFMQIVAMAIAFITLKPIDRQYYIITKHPSEVVEAKIRGFLKDNNLNYQHDEYIREYLHKWRNIFHIEESGVLIKILKLRYQEWKTMITVGRRTKRNKQIVITLTNEIAKWLDVENYKPISK